MVGATELIEGLAPAHDPLALDEAGGLVGSKIWACIRILRACSGRGRGDSGEGTMNRVWRRISAEPAVITGAVVASINVVATFRVWTPTPEQLAAINTALAAIFALLIRATVEHRYGTPVQLRRARPREAQKSASQAPATMNEPV